MTHTPGPWRINTRLSRNGAPVISGDGRDIAKALYHMGSEDPEVDANARLIASAPELLEALECLMKLQSIPSMFRLPSNCEEVIKAKAAIKKAGGE